MSPPYTSVSGGKPRRKRQDNDTRGRQRTRRGNSPALSSFPYDDDGFDHDLSPYGPAGFDGRARRLSPTRARDFMSPLRRRSPERPRGGRDGMALDGLGYRTYSPQPSGLRRRFQSPERHTTAQVRGRSPWAGDRGSSSGSSERDHERKPRSFWTSFTRKRHQSPPSRRYAPRSTSSGHLSFGTTRHSSPSRLSTISSLNIGPPALRNRLSSRYRSPTRKSSTTDFSVPSVESFRSSTHGHRIVGPPSFTVRDSSASRNVLTRVKRSEYRHERESPREAMQRTTMNSRVPEHARVPDRAIPVDSVRHRGMERYQNPNGLPYGEDAAPRLGMAGAQRDHDCTGMKRRKRVTGEGFRNWYWGKKE